MARSFIKFRKSALDTGQDYTLFLISCLSILIYWYVYGQSTCFFSLFPCGSTVLAEPLLFGGVVSARRKASAYTGQQNIERTSVP
jgi:hypothetical protein